MTTKKFPFIEWSNLRLYMTKKRLQDEREDETVVVFERIRPEGVRRTIVFSTIVLLVVLIP